ILPRSDEAKRRTVLIGAILPIHTCCKERQWVLRFVEPETLHVREFDSNQRISLARHLIRSIDGMKFHELGAGIGLQFVDEICERIPMPWYDHGPGLDTAHAIDTVFNRYAFQQIIKGVL